MTEAAAESSGTPASSAHSEGGSMPDELENFPLVNPRRFVDHVAIVTGAGSGIGRATAERLAWEGTRVLCFDRNADSASDTVSRVREAGGTALAVVGDVRRRADLEEASTKAENAWGRVTLLVNNAGLVTMKGLAELSEEDWDLVLDVNLKGQFLAAQTVGQRIAAGGGGAIVCLSTVESVVVSTTSGADCQPHYNASKGGVLMLTKALAHELGRFNVRVNAVAPGGVKTAFTGRLFEDDDLPDVVRNRLIIKRLARPAEIAGAIAFLLSDEARYITGTQLVVDGGWLVY